MTQPAGLAASQEADEALIAAFLRDRDPAAFGGLFDRHTPALYALAVRLDAMLKLDFDAAIPGAGPVLTRADVEMFRTKFSTVIARAIALVRTGVAKEELLKPLKTDDIGWAPRIPQSEPLNRVQMARQDIYPFASDSVGATAYIDLIQN